MRGRKPKPLHLRLVEGNRGRRPVNQREPKPAGDLAGAPGWFTDEQRAVWRYAIDHAPAGLLKHLDGHTLAIWCIAAEMHQRAVVSQATIDAAGGLPLLSRSPEGYTIQSPYLPIINKQAAIMLKAAAELGFTPSSRSRITVQPDDDGEKSVAQKYFTA